MTFTRIVTLAALSFLIACHSSSPNSNKESRPKLVKAIKDLKSWITHRDKNGIAQLFQFPIPDSTIIGPDDSAYTAWDKDHDAMPRNAYDTLFPKLSKNWKLQTFAELFKYLNVDKLSKTDSLDRTVKKKEAACLYTYTIYIESDSLIHIKYGSYDDPKYKKNDTEEEYGTGCEYVTFWTLSWDGKHLHLVRIDAAG